YVEAFLQQPQAGVGPPAAVYVHQAGGGSVGQFRNAFSGEPVTEQVGDEQQCVGCGHLGVPGGRHQLEQGVERLYLQPVDLVQLFGGQVAEDLLGDSVGACITVVDLVAQQISVVVQQPVVHGPGIDAHRRKSTVFLGCSTQTGHRTGVQGQYVPVLCATVAAAQCTRAVVTPYVLLGVKFSVTDLACNEPSAGDTEVDGCMRCMGGTYFAARRKVAATPPSTGTCNPVFCDSSSAVS